MAYKIGNEQNKPIHGRVHELLSKHSVDDPDKSNPKRDRFLTLLKQRYGYTNDKAIDELERLLKQFYRTNRSLTIHHKRPNLKSPLVE